jgi:hypothetical protein
MPVTAKLSRRFYERLGDEIVNELVDWFNAVDATYRSDLRETNELNFARFMASVDQRFAEQDARFERRLLEQYAGFERRLAEIDARLAAFRADVLKWMFVYWSGTMLALAGFVFAMLQRR